MKKVCAALAVACAALAALAVYQELPSGKPSKPIYVQRLEQLLQATNVGDWKAGCDAAPTAAYSLADYAGVALQYGAQSFQDLGPLCETILKTATTDLKGKPVGLDYKILYWEDEGTANANAERLVIVRLHWHGRNIPASTIVFHLDLIRLPWGKESAKCGGKPCTPLRWFVMGAT